MIELKVLSPQPTEASSDLAQFLRLMADGTRRRIFLRLLERETCNCEMVDLLGLPQNLISHHLRALRQAGLIQARRDQRDQRWIYYSVDRHLVASLTGEFQALFDVDRHDAGPLVCDPSSETCC